MISLGGQSKLGGTILQSVWLLTWEGTQGLGLSANTKIAGLISGRRGNSFVEDFARHLFCSSRCSVGELVGEVKRPDRSLNIPVGGNGSFWLGHNPFIFGRRVHEFRVEQDSEGNELVSWIEPATYGVDPNTFVPHLKNEPAVRSLRRELSPVFRLLER